MLTPAAQRHEDPSGIRHVPPVRATDHRHVGVQPANQPLELRLDARVRQVGQPEKHGLAVVDPRYTLDLRPDIGRDREQSLRNQ